MPSITLSNDYVKMRVLEPSVPRALNQRSLGLPRGVMLGFTPVVSPGNDVLTLAVDPVENFSLVKVGSTDERVNVDIFTDQNLQLDFTGHTQWPVYVVASAVYTQGQVTQGRIETRLTTATAPNEVNICLVDKPAANLVVSTEFPTDRQPPLAFTGQRVGYFPDGAIASLQAASATVAEIITARDSIYTGVAPSLSDRLAADMDGSAMSDRLALASTYLLSNAHTVESGDSTVNVSGSFAQTSREFPPEITPEPGGGPSTAGVATAAPYNLALVVEEATGERLVNTTLPSPGVADLDPLHGVLTVTTGTIGGGRQVRFTNAVTNIDGAGTFPFFTTLNPGGPLNEGDIVLAPDGLYYEIDSIIDGDNATISAAFQGGVPAGPPVAQPNAAFRRYTLELRQADDTPYVVDVDTEIRFVVPGFFRADQAIFNGLGYLRRKAVTPKVPSATDSLAGKILLAQAGALAGVIRFAKSNGILVGAGNFSTLNFPNPGPGGSPAASSPAPGIADITVIGADGPPGDDANVGPPGDDGAPGAGYTESGRQGNFFEVSPEFGDQAGGGPLSGSFSFDFSTGSPVITDVAPCISGGFAFWDQFAFSRAALGEFLITGTASAAVSWSLTEPNTHRIKIYMGAAPQ